MHMSVCMHLTLSSRVTRVALEYLRAS
jgi:hypothetical protein